LGNNTLVLSRENLDVTMGSLYVLNGRKAVGCKNVKAWGQWFETADRVVARTAGRGVDVSTVFLGIDHGYGEGKLSLFETMTFPVGGTG
jgi:hypothetical protein